MISGLIQNACLNVPAFCVDQLLPLRAFLFKGCPPELNHSATCRGTQKGLWSTGSWLTTNYSNKTHHKSDYNSNRSSSSLSAPNVTSNKLSSKILALKLSLEVYWFQTSYRHSSSRTLASFAQLNGKRKWRL